MLEEGENTSRVENRWSPSKIRKEVGTNVKTIDESVS